MAERIKVGIVYSNDENWIGGSYYIQNLVASLNTLDEELKPLIIVLTATKDQFDQIEQTGYPYLQYRHHNYQPHKLGIIRRIINKAVYILKGYVIFPEPSLLNHKDIDVVFPADPGLIVEKRQKKIYWIPDFQEIYYPDFFSKPTIDYRKQNHLFISKTKDAVVFSSQQAMNDFKTMLPNYSCKIFKLSFAVTHPILNQSNESKLRAKYDLKIDFYIAPNQFWIHKNQKVIIEAIGILKSKNKLTFQLVFTGKEHDPRNPDYTTSLKKLTDDLGLGDSIKFLGFIDRIEQLQLMKASLGVIQPSLFEGWSTVVEDGKALNKFIIASDLPVHREQLYNNTMFFDPKDSTKLAELMLDAVDQKVIPLNYSDLIKEYAAQFISVIYNVISIKKYQ